MPGSEVNCREELKNKHIEATVSCVMICTMKLRGKLILIQKILLLQPSFEVGPVTVFTEQDWFQIGPVVQRLPAGRDRIGVWYFCEWSLKEDVWMIMVYAIWSETYKRIYVGMCKDVEKRLHQHNAGVTRSTKPFRRWSIIFTENCANWKKEEFWKSIINQA